MSPLHSVACGHRHHSQPLVGRLRHFARSRDRTKPRSEAAFFTWRRSDQALDSSAAVTGIPAIADIARFVPAIAITVRLILAKSRFGNFRQRTLHVWVFVVGSSLMSTPASRNGSMRAADTDRIHVAQMLTDAAANGRLPMTEYEDRLAKAYAAQTYDELERVSADLPGASTSAPSGGPCRPAPSTVLLAILSGFERRGRWNVPRRLTSVALFGGGVIDLRYADFTSPDVEIHSYSIFGGQTIVLPPEVNVDVRGVGVMGAFDHIGGLGSPGAPHITIRGFSLWGSVGIKRKKRKAPG
jgi:hypothetical protein